jgi:hypothetical protein
MRRAIEIRLFTLPMNGAAAFPADLRGTSGARLLRITIATPRLSNG